MSHFVQQILWVPLHAAHQHHHFLWIFRPISKSFITYCFLWYWVCYASPLFFWQIGINWATGSPPYLCFDVSECISVLATSFNPRTWLLLIDLFKVFNFVLHINQKNVILFYYDTIFLIVQVSGINSENHPKDLLLPRLCCKCKLQQSIQCLFLFIVVYPNV